MLRALSRAGGPGALPAGARSSRREKLVEERDTNQSHLRMIYRPDIAVSDVRKRAALTIYSTLLGGSMGSRLFEEIREKRGLCYSVYALDHAFADVPILQLGSGLESGKCVEAYTRMREIVDELRDDGPTEEEVHRARAYAAGRRVLAFENTNAVARYAANQKIVFGEDIDPDAAIVGARRRHLRRGPRGRRGRCRQPRRRLRRTPFSRRVLAQRDHPVDWGPRLQGDLLGHPHLVLASPAASPSASGA